MEKNNIQEEKIIPAEKRRMIRNFPLAMIIFLSIFISAFFGAVFGFMAGTFSDSIPSERLGILGRYLADKDTEDARIENIKQIIQEDSAVTDIVDSKSPAVVSIIISQNVPVRGDILYDPFGWYQFFGQDPGSGDMQGGSEEEKQRIGSGSGFIVSRDGMIVTNKHVVIEQSAEYTVITNDDKEYPARILARDPVNDIAIMKIEGQDFQFLELGDSDSLKIGQTVLAIGNSLGEFSNTVSKGIISGLGRNLTASGGRGETERLSGIIQTDAAINSGNSGGPLLNMSGEVIGINVAMAQGAQSIGFSIPVNQIKRVVEQVRSTGEIKYPYLGVRYIPVDAEVKSKIDSPFDYGALVVRGNTVTDFAVIPGSPADKAGIMENDVILEISGIRIDENNSLGDLVAKSSIGDTVVLKVWHRGEVKEVEVVLAERND